MSFRPFTIGSLPLALSLVSLCYSQIRIGGVRICDSAERLPAWMLLDHLALLPPTERRKLIFQKQLMCMPENRVH